MINKSQAFSDNINDDYGDEECFYERSSTLIIPEDVVKAIDRVIPSDDPIDKPEFNSVNYINSLFSTEQSLYNIDDVIAQMQSKIRNFDYEIRDVVTVQATVWKGSRKALLNAQQVTRKLLQQTSEIKCKAEESEENVKEITRDVKQLDCIKRNLTSAVTTLNHLHMLVGGMKTLRGLTSSRQYGEIVMPLQGTIEVMNHFVAYSDIPQIEKLADEVNTMKSALSQQIIEDFQEILIKSNARTVTHTRRLAEACLVVDVLGPNVKNDLLNWFVKVQLNEYLFLFNGCEDIGWLDKIDRRYTWFKKHLLQFEDKFGAMFPPNWKVSERITVEFCKITRSELSKVMSKRAKEIDVKLLLYAIQRTSNLEGLLAVKFTGKTLSTESDSVVQLNTEIESRNVPNNKPVASSNLISNPFADDFVEELESSATIPFQKPSQFHNFIGECFLPYLYIYIESLDRSLYELMEKCVLEFKYKHPVSEIVKGVLPFCADLFMFFKKSLVQCNHLSNGSPMLALCSLFKKYIREYAMKILLNNLPKLGGKTSNSSLSSSMTSITRDLRDISSASSLIQSFLKEEEVSRFSKFEIARVCCILTTAEYSLEACQQLEGKLKEKVEPSLVEKIDLSQEQDIFHSVISNCIKLLVQDLEVACEPALNVMNRIQWQTLESVGDQSPYVTVLASHLKTNVSFIKDSLSSTRKYFTQFCIRFTASFIPKFIQSLYKCKPLNTVGAEQLLLDTHTLKTLLLDLPSIGSPVTRKSPTSYTKVVLKGISRGEVIIKMVMAPVNPDTSFVDQFTNLLPDTDIQEFQKVLDMKGLKSLDKTHLLTVFRQRYSSEFVTGSSLFGSQKHTSVRKINYEINKNSFVVNNY